MKKYIIVGAVGLAVTLAVAIIHWKHKDQPSEVPTIWNDQTLYEHTLNTMVKYGYSAKEAQYIINVCSTMNNPNWCIILATHIARHETKSGKEGVGASQNNLYGIKPCGATSQGTFCEHTYYPNRMASFEDRVWRYNKRRWKNSCMEMITRSEYTPHNPGPWIINCERMEANFLPLKLLK